MLGLRSRQFSTVQRSGRAFPTTVGLLRRLSAGFVSALANPIVGLLHSVDHLSAGTWLGWRTCRTRQRCDRHERERQRRRYQRGCKHATHATSWLALRRNQQAQPQNRQVQLQAQLALAPLAPSSRQRSLPPNQPCRAGCHGKLSWPFLTLAPLS